MDPEGFSRYKQSTTQLSKENKKIRQPLAPKGQFSTNGIGSSIPTFFGYLIVSLASSVACIVIARCDDPLPNTPSLAFAGWYSQAVLVSGLQNWKGGLPEQIQRLDIQYDSNAGTAQWMPLVMGCRCLAAGRRALRLEFALLPIAATSCRWSSQSSVVHIPVRNNSWQGRDCREKSG